MIYRLLRPEEWDRLYILGEAKLGGPIPPPETSCAVIAETEEGQIAGVLFLQLALHLEPLSIDLARRGQVSFLRMAEEMDKELKRAGGGTYYVFTPDKQIAGMCRLQGMKQLPYRVWAKTVATDEEIKPGSPIPAVLEPQPDLRAEGA